MSTPDKDPPGQVPTLTRPPGPDPWKPGLGPDSGPVRGTGRWLRGPALARYSAQLEDRAGLWYVYHEYQALRASAFLPWLW